MRARDESRGKALVAAPSPGADEGVGGAAGSGMSSETAVQKCGS